MEKRSSRKIWRTPLVLKGIKKDSSNLVLRNRIIKAATHSGSRFEEMGRTYERLARNGVGMIVVAYVSVSKTNKTFENQHHIGTDNLREWTRMVKRVTQHGAKMCAQLHHPGLFTWSPHSTPQGPSLFFLPSKVSIPQVMTKKRIHEVREEYRVAAELCKRAGFECIELHCGHGYLLSQFLTPVINRRSDEFGGNAERRAEFPKLCLEACMESTLPVVVKMNSEDGFPLGLNVEDAIVAAKVFLRTGAHAIVPSYGYTSLNGFGMLRGNVPYEKMAQAFSSVFASFLLRFVGKWLVPQIEYESLFLRDHAKRFVDELGKNRVIYIGGADSVEAIETVLSDGCIGVQLGRPLIREPWFVRRMERAAENDDDVKSLCVRCNYCTLSSIDPIKFPYGCIFLKKEDDIENLCSKL